MVKVIIILIYTVQQCLKSQTTSYVFVHTCHILPPLRNRFGAVFGSFCRLRRETSISQN